MDHERVPIPTPAGHSNMVVIHRDSGVFDSNPCGTLKHGCDPPRQWDFWFQPLRDTQTWLRSTATVESLIPTPAGHSDMVAIHRDSEIKTSQGLTIDHQIVLVRP